MKITLNGSYYKNPTNNRLCQDLNFQFINTNTVVTIENSNKSLLEKKVEKLLKVNKFEQL